MQLYVIMANGKGQRWGNHNGVPKQLIVINGETLLARTVRLVQSLDPGAEIIISSGNPKCEVEGILRHKPINGDLEIDRFVYELIQDNICFLYGDTYYTESTLKKIIHTDSESLLFFGSLNGIIAVKAQDGVLLRKHIDNVKELFLTDKIENCKGWQLYQSFTGLPYDRIAIGSDFIVIEDRTQDFNSPEDLERFQRTTGKAR